MRRLRLTRRALDDLELEPEGRCAKDASAYVDDHQVVQAFVERRRQSPDGQEVTQLPRSPHVVYNLHAGRWRGLTWHDRERDVVWLLGVGWHESGSSDDAYALLKRRDASGQLFPTTDDYLDLETIDVESAVENLAHEAPALIEEARSAPGVEIRRELIQTIDAAALVQVVVVEHDAMEEIWVGLSILTDEDALRLPPTWLAVVLTAFFPGASYEELRFHADFCNRPARSGEIVVSWCPP